MRTSVAERAFLRQPSLPATSRSGCVQNPCPKSTAHNWPCPTLLRRSRHGHQLGYARVSTTDQQPQLQVDALERAGCYRVFTETASGAPTGRPRAAPGPAASGDTLVVWKLDRLGRSLRHLVDTVTGLADRGIGFRSLQEAIDTTTPAASSCSTCSRLWPSSNAT